MRVVGVGVGVGVVVRVVVVVGVGVVVVVVVVVVVAVAVAVAVAVSMLMAVPGIVTAAWTMHMLVARLMLQRVELSVEGVVHNLQREAVQERERSDRKSYLSAHRFDRGGGHTITQQAECFVQERRCRRLCV